MIEYSIVNSGLSGLKTKLGPNVPIFKMAVMIFHDTHFLDVSDPLLYCCSSGVDYQIEACFTIHNVFCVICRQKLKHKHQSPFCICIFGHWILPFDVAQGGESFDFAQDREPVERLVEPFVICGL